MPAAMDSAPQAVARKPRLLIVDDEDGVRQSMRLIFKDDFDVLLAEDGPSAIEMAQQAPVDVAVLDIRMASMTGIEVLERLKIVDPTIEAVMMTAYETSDTLRQALRLRACDYINKPFELATMRTAVAAALQRRTLTSEVKTNSEKLEELQSELQQQKMEGEMVRTRGEIYASIIHDINGPLTIISGLLQMINQKMGEETQLRGEDLEVVKDRLKRITRQVTNCIEISRRYLAHLRQPQHENMRVWANQILSDLAELARAHPSARNNQLFIQPLGDDVTIAIHGTDLMQLLLNLTINALQCAPNIHRVEVSGKLLNTALDLQHFEDGPEDILLNRESFKNTAPLIAFSVQDNGPGISPEILKRIFEPYFTTKEKRNGTGLGLCIVQRMVKIAQGAIHVHTKIGQGTVFTVYLPAGN
jgi:two-component system, sensor histidine kinase and response regulator